MYRGRRPQGPGQWDGNRPTSAAWAVGAMPFYRLTIEVDGQLWTRVDKVASAAADDRVFELTRRGRLRFGDGVHGSMPPLGAEIVVRYREGAGAGGEPSI